MRWIFLFAALSFLQVSCYSTPKLPEEDEVDIVYLQRAQDAYEIQDYKSALFYYKLFQIRFPDHHNYIVASEYGIAWTYYKMGKEKLSLEKAEFIIELFETSPFTSQYPQKFLVLTKILLEKLDPEKYQPDPNRDPTYEIM